MIPNQFTAERDRLDMIFERQHELMMKFDVIEHQNGQHPVYGGVYDLNDRMFQARVKDFCWRVTEELGEMINATSDPHFLEEMSDAVHFMTELCIMTGIKTEDILGRSFHETCRLEVYWRQFLTEYHPPLVKNYTKEDVLDIISKLALAANCLKLKPWKQTAVLTDEATFKLHLIGAYLKLLKLARKTGVSADGFFRLYYDKSEVNNFRIGSKY